MKFFTSYIILYPVISIALFFIIYIKCKFFSSNNGDTFSQLEEMKTSIDELKSKGDIGLKIATLFENIINESLNGNSIPYHSLVMLVCFTPIVRYIITFAMIIQK